MCVSVSKPLEATAGASARERRVSWRAGYRQVLCAGRLAGPDLPQAMSAFNAFDRR